MGAATPTLVKVMLIQLRTQQTRSQTKLARNYQILSWKAHNVRFRRRRILGCSQVLGIVRQALGIVRHCREKHSMPIMANNKV